MWPKSMFLKVPYEIGFSSSHRVKNIKDTAVMYLRLIEEDELSVSGRRWQMPVTYITMHGM